jgi:hypothetical protein
MTAADEALARDEAAVTLARETLTLLAEAVALLRRPERGHRRMGRRRARRGQAGQVGRPADDHRGPADRRGRTRRGGGDMSDHYHYDYASTSHDHSGRYADDRHDHSLDYAEKYHRHYDDESTVAGLREDLGRAEERIRELEETHDVDIRKLWDHISNMPGGV